MSVKSFNHIPEFEAKLQAAAAHTVFRASLMVEREAVSRARFKTGFLRNSIGSEAVGLSGSVFAGANYAIYREQHDHFLTDSLESVVKDIPNLLKLGGA